MPFIRSLLAAVCGVATATVASVGVHEERSTQISEIVQHADVLWQAGVNARFSSLAPGASRKLCGVKDGWQQQIRQAMDHGEILVWEEEVDIFALQTVPDNFDSEQHWPQCAKVIGDIRDQSNCGCCWAFAGAEAASDRMCIASNASILLPLSAEDVCFCASADGCEGGMIFTPWRHIKHGGAVTGGQYNGSGTFGSGYCSDFSLPHCHHHGPQGDDPFPAEGQPGCPFASSPQCPTKCDTSAVGEHRHFRHDKYSFRGKIVVASGERHIQRMIMAGGPVSAALTVYSDFENYVGGIYHHVVGEEVGGHAVKLVGWGVEGDVKYWRVANSWNSYWGEKGYFRIRRGCNESGIENWVVGASHRVSWGKSSELPSLPDFLV
mmetsp:Transcript_32915/g.83376  ORF Transcript_32915/g.83376 Transcript_32915/m.83376 type:complete len:379 (-) Transcript_32915:116-1252(-)